MFASSFGALALDKFYIAREISRPSRLGDKKKLSSELAGQQVIILREGTSRSRGQDALKANIMAAKIIAECVRSSLGPKGMDKMLVDGFGDVTLTNDGATILDEMEVQHRSAKMMLEVAEKTPDGYKVDIDDVKVEKKPGESLTDTALIKGIVLDKEIVHPGMPKRVEDAKIALVDAPLEVEKTEFDAKINIENPEQMKAFLDEEEKMLKDMTDKVSNSGANVLLCEKGIHDALCVVRDVVLDPRVVAGGGAPEAEVARRLREHAQKLSGKEQLAVIAFGEALETLPTALAENAGLDPIDILVQLRAAHEKGQLWAGVDVNESKVADLKERGVLEPLGVKVQVIKSAAEAAGMILKIDDVIAAAKSSAGGQGGPKGKDEGDDEGSSDF